MISVSSKMTYKAKFSWKNKKDWTGLKNPLYTMNMHGNHIQLSTYLRSKGALWMSMDLSEIMWYAYDT